VPKNEYKIFFPNHFPNSKFDIIFMFFQYHVFCLYKNISTNHGHLSNWFVTQKKCLKKKIYNDFVIDFLDILKN
jgi:hypothetical protein